MISLIAAVDEKNGLGKNNQLLCHLPADLQYFKKTTLGKPVVMGRKTFESIGKPLPGRRNIVLSRHAITIAGVEVVNTLQKALDLTVDADETMVIGGADLFRLSMPVATRIYLTRIHHQFDADIFFPDFNEFNWYCMEKMFRPHDEKNQYDLTFSRYDRVN